MKKLLVFLVCLSSTMLFAQDLHYVIDETGVQGTHTTVVGVFMLDGVEIYNGEGMQEAGGGQIEIGVFDQDGICRGAKLPTWRSKSNQWIYQLKLRGDNGFSYPVFKVYDHATETEFEYVLDIEETIVWTSGGKYGSTTAPYSINFTSPSGGYTKHIVGYSADYNQDTNPNDHYYLIASPLNEESVAVSTIAGMTDGDYDLYYFDQNGDNEQKEWINCNGVEGFAMQRGVGYLYAHGTDIDLTFTGAAYEGDGTVVLSYNGDAYWKGWNLVGNPFTSEAYANRDYYALQNGKELSLVTDNAAVGAMEGIFVLAAENETEMTFTTEPAGSKGSMVSLNVSRANRVLDRTVVRFGGDRVLPKFQLRATSTKVYIPMEGKDYAVVSAEGMGEMPVNFKAEKSGSYTISAKGEEVNFTYLHLIDNMTGADVDLLATPSYSFNASTTDYESRFRLLFATGGSEDGDNFGFINGAGNLSIYGIEGEATLQVMDVNGRVLSTETFSGSYEKSLNVAAGIYMLRLTNGDNVKVQKMVIR